MLKKIKFKLKKSNNCWRNSWKWSNFFLFFICAYGEVSLEFTHLWRWLPQSVQISCSEMNQNLLRLCCHSCFSQWSEGASLRSPVPSSWASPLPPLSVWWCQDGCSVGLLWSTALWFTWSWLYKSLRKTAFRKQWRQIAAISWQLSNLKVFFSTSSSFQVEGKIKLTGNRIISRTSC